MASIKVHLFTTEAEAQKAIDLINKGEGIPVDENATTLTYCEYEIINKDVIIRADEITQKYLGEPIKYELAL